MGEVVERAVCGSRNACAYPQRAVSGFYKKDELALLIQRRTSRKPIAGLRA
jgi:hypothetical protein